MNFPSTKTPEEALTLALLLSITAPDKTGSKECIDIADSIAAGLDAETVELCKQKALAISREDRS